VFARSEPARVRSLTSRQRSQKGHDALNSRTLCRHSSGTRSRQQPFHARTAVVRCVALVQQGIVNWDSVPRGFCRQRLARSGRVARCVGRIANASPQARSLHHAGCSLLPVVVRASRLHRECRNSSRRQECLPYATSFAMPVANFSSGKEMHQGSPVGRRLQSVECTNPPIRTNRAKSYGKEPCRVNCNLWQGISYDRGLIADHRRLRSVHYLSSTM
jgi:hypothetical protein